MACFEQLSVFKSSSIIISRLNPKKIAIYLCVGGNSFEVSCSEHHNSLACVIKTNFICRFTFSFAMIVVSSNKNLDDGC